MKQLRVGATGTTDAEIDVVWSLVANANRYPHWGPWSDGGYEPPSDGPSREGSVQWFRFGRRTTSVEQILEVEAPWRLVYTVIKGIPVKNYRAEVILTPTHSTGTSIRWSATWDKTILGTLAHRKLKQVYPQIVASLIAAANRQAATNQ